MAAPGEDLHLVGHARLELADGRAAPRPSMTNDDDKVGQKEAKVRGGNRNER